MCWDAPQYTDDKKDSSHKATHRKWAKAVKVALYDGTQSSCAGCDFLFLTRLNKDAEWRAYATLGPEHL